MKHLRRALNLLTVLLLVLAAWGLVYYMLNGQLRRPVPLSFIGLFAGFPALANAAAAFLAWKQRPTLRAAALGLALSSVSCFVWVVVCATMIELSVKQPMHDNVWRLLAFALSLLVPPIASALNIAHFRSVVLAAKAQ